MSVRGLHQGRTALDLTVIFIFAACGANRSPQSKVQSSTALTFGPEIYLGTVQADPSTPFLRYSPDGKLFAAWTEDHETPWPDGKPHPGQVMSCWS